MNDITILENIPILINESKCDLLKCLGIEVNGEYYYLHNYFKKRGDGTFEVLKSTQLPKDVLSMFEDALSSINIIQKNKKMETKKACTVFLDRTQQCDEMDLDYSLIEEKVKELNEMGVDITLQEIGDIIETKFYGVPQTADLKRWGNYLPDDKRFCYNGKLIYPQYTLLREKQVL